MIGGKSYETVVYFSENFAWTNGGLLGRTGFFDRFTVTLNPDMNFISIKEGTALLDERYKICTFCGTETIQIPNGRTNFCDFCGSSLKVLQTSEGHLTGGLLI